MFLTSTYNVIPTHKVSRSTILSINKTRNDYTSNLPNLKSDKNLEKVTVRRAPTSESSISWQRVNQEFQGLFTTNNDIYSFAPEVVDTNIPLRDSLVLAEAVDTRFKKTPLHHLKEPECGLFGKVKFLRFKNDPDGERWFAIKRPMSIFHKLFSTKTCTFTAVEKFRKNLNISLKVGNHPNFMKVHGIIVKNVKNGTDTKPYMILEYIDGTKLRDLEKLNSEEKLHLFSQLKDALVHLYRLNILPVDANLGNFLITKNNTLKLIDFDEWQEEQINNHEILGKGLYDVACIFVHGLCQKKKMDIPIPESDFQTVEELAENLDNLTQYL